MKKKKILVLFSGGKDSFLSACKLIEDGYNISLVTYENGCGLKGENAKHGADRIIKKYGKDKVDFIGVINISGIWRSFLLPYLNMTPSEIKSKYGEVTISQFNCLTCRMSMYICSIILCKKYNINIIADGARENQGFVIELEVMINKFKEMFEKYNIEFLTPVYKMTSDWTRKNQLLNRGFNPKVLEPQCLIGVPLKDNKQPDNEVISGTIKLYEDYVIPLIDSIIEENLDIPFENNEDLI